MINVYSKVTSDADGKVAYSVPLPNLDQENTRIGFLLVCNCSMQLTKRMKDKIKDYQNWIRRGLKNHSVSDLLPEIRIRVRFRIRPKIEQIPFCFLHFFL